MDDRKLDEPPRPQDPGHLAEHPLWIGDVHQAHERGHCVETRCTEREHGPIAQDVPNPPRARFDSGRDERLGDVEGHNARALGRQQAGVVPFAAAQVETRQPINRREQREERRRVDEVPVDIEPRPREFRPRRGVGVPQLTGVRACHTAMLALLAGGRTRQQFGIGNFRSPILAQGRAALVDDEGRPVRDLVVECAGWAVEPAHAQLPLRVGCSARIAANAEAESISDWGTAERDRHQSLGHGGQGRFADTSAFVSACSSTRTTSPARFRRPAAFSITSRCGDVFFSRPSGVMYEVPDTGCPNSSSRRAFDAPSTDSHPQVLKAPYVSAQEHFPLSVRRSGTDLG